MKDKIKEFLASLSADGKRKIVLGCVAFVILGLFYFGYVKKEEIKAIDKPQEVKKFSLVDPTMAEETWLNKAHGDIEAINREVKELKKIVEILVQNNGKTTSQPSTSSAGEFKPSAEKPKETEASIFEQLNKITTPPTSSIDGGVQMSNLAPPSAIEAKNAGAGGSDVFAVPNPSRAKNMEPVLMEGGDNTGKRNPGKASGAASVAANHDANLGQGPEATYTSIAVILPPQSQATIEKQQKAKNEKDKKPVEIVYSIPTGSFMKGKLLNGIFAATGEKASANPYPMLVSIQDLSFLPNDVRQDWDGCFILGEGYGQLSSERVMGRAINISCINNSTKKVMDLPMKGYFVGNDGYNGLRGEVVSKQGQFLLRTLAASFIEGVAMGFNNAASTVTMGESGTVTKTTDSISSFNDGMKVGALGGAANAATKLADFYMKLAEDLFPGIEVEAGREATIILTEPLQVKFEHNLFEGGLNNENL